MTRVISLPANPYHKAGSPIDLPDDQAQSLIEKGYAKAEGHQETKMKDSGNDNSDNKQESKNNNQN